MAATADRPTLGAQVFVTAQARTLDLATCLVQDSGVLVIVSASMRHALRERLDKYILYGDEARPPSCCVLRQQDEFLASLRSAAVLLLSACPTHLMTFQLAQLSWRALVAQPCSRSCTTCSFPTLTLVHLK